MVIDENRILISKNITLFATSMVFAFNSVGVRVLPDIWRSFTHMVQYVNGVFSKGTAYTD